MKSYFCVLLRVPLLCVGAALAASRSHTRTQCLLKKKKSKRMVKLEILSCTSLLNRAGTAATQ
jgi:hypothetical protein